MKMKEFLNEIENSYKEQFPKSKIVAELDNRFYNSISITCFIANDINEVANRIWQNDMLSIYFSIDSINGEFAKDITIESEIPENLKIEVSRKSYLIKPENRNMCYGRRKLSFRKTTGNYNKILKSLDKFFRRLRISLEKDVELNAIHDNHISLLLEKLA